MDWFTTQTDLDTYCFEPGYDNIFRKAVHRMAERCNLYTKSFGRGRGRFLVISYEIIHTYKAGTKRPWGGGGGGGGGGCGGVGQ